MIKKTIKNLQFEHFSIDIFNLNIYNKNVQVERRKERNMYLTSEIKTALRKKRGSLNLTKGEAAEQLGINRLTYGRLESPARNEKVRKSTYEAITQWLAKGF